LFLLSCLPVFPASLLVLNKTDLLPEAQRLALDRELRGVSGLPPVCHISCLTSEGLQDFLSVLHASVKTLWVSTAACMNMSLKSHNIVIKSYNRVFIKRTKYIVSKNAPRNVRTQTPLYVKSNIVVWRKESWYKIIKNYTFLTGAALRSRNSPTISRDASRPITCVYLNIAVKSHSIVCHTNIIKGWLRNMSYEVNVQKNVRTRCSTV